MCSPYFGFFKKSFISTTSTYLKYDTIQTSPHPPPFEDRDSDLVTNQLSQISESIEENKTELQEKKGKKEKKTKLTNHFALSWSLTLGPNMY